jgi:hypothetical protein
MSKKIVKLIVAASMLAGCLGVGVTPRAANAVVCANICCDPSCSSIRVCRRGGSGCVCDQLCTPADN